MAFHEEVEGFYVQTLGTKSHGFHNLGFEWDVNFVVLLDLLEFIGWRNTGTKKRRSLRSFLEEA